VAEGFWFSVFMFPAFRQLYRLGFLLFIAASA